MDNRDRNIRCPFYRPGSHSAPNHIKMRTIHCQGYIRLSTAFKTVEERTAHANKYCKQNYRNCPLYQYHENMM